MHDPMKITMLLVKRIVIAICCVIVLSACGSWRGAEPLPSPTATRTPSPSSTPTVTATLTPTPILSVEATPEATSSDPVEREMQQALRLLYVTENETCWKAARTLGRIGPAAIPELIPILKEAENEEVRGAAAHALGEMGAEAIPAVPALVEALEDEESLVRLITAEALGKIGPGAVEAVPALLKVVAEDRGADLYAVYALANIGPEPNEVVPVLIQRLRDDDVGSYLGEAIRSTLEKITGHDFRYDADAWQQWWEASRCLTDCQTPDQAVPSPSATSTPEIAYSFGSLVIALQDETVWLLTKNEAPQLFTQGYSPDISPDGHWIVVVRDPEEYSTVPQYWLIDTHNHTERRLLSPEAGKTCFIYDRTWSPDSSYVAFTCGGDIKHMYFGDLWQVDVVDGTVTQITERDGGAPHFSPDGKWIATSTPWGGYGDSSITLWHVESKKNQVLLKSLFPFYLEWVDDSSGLVAAFPYADTAGQGLELWWIPVEAPRVQLGRLSNAFNVVWQPNTERLIYNDNRDAYPYSIHMANRDGSGDQVIPGSEGMLSFPDSVRWSPDGHWLLLVDNNYLPYIVDTYDLHAPIALSVDRVYGWVDATHYLASAYQEDASELYLCTPPETCQRLAQFEGSIQSLSYTEQVYQP
ncbi:MAG TPA: HEAT repeat domain-containing protein [Anaerolineae bacterium]|nr:HEAT repeat domain-containing protein [Anaerolineae bacterium]HQI87417.1 HEAT repeat domain-containing protein [Anaerolineae bacterium]